MRKFEARPHQSREPTAQHGEESHWSVRRRTLHANAAIRADRGEFSTRFEKHYAPFVKELRERTRRLMESGEGIEKAIENQWHVFGTVTRKQEANPVKTTDNKKISGGRACKPDSVRCKPRGPHRDDHSSSPGLATGIQRPTRGSIRTHSLVATVGGCCAKGSVSRDTLNEPGQLSPPIWPCTARGFPCSRCYRRDGGLLPHLFTLACARTIRHPEGFPPGYHRAALAGGLFSVALSVTWPLPAASPGVTRRVAHSSLSRSGVRTFLPFAMRTVGTKVLSFDP